MKTYNNGPRKGMMYGGAAKRKPMMYGGMATKKRKKMQYGGTANEMSAKKATGQQMPREDRKSKNVEPAMGMPKMAGGGKAMLGDLDKDGKMSGYEKARQNAINKNMKNRKA
jgi:imidazole glycerol phosphate synthase subunit HisF